MIVETVLEYTAQHPDARMFYSELERMAQNLLKINVVTLSLWTSCFLPLPVYETGLGRVSKHSHFSHFSGAARHSSEGSRQCQKTAE